MKKILYICEAIGGGVRKHIVDVLTHSDNSKYSISLIYSKTGVDEVFRDSLNSFGDKGIKLHAIDNFVNHISLIDDIKALYKIVKIINEVQPDIVHCHSSKAGALGRVAAKMCRIKSVIYTPHAYSFQNYTLSKRKRSLYILIEKILGKITNITINVSEGERQNAFENNIVGENNSIVIYNGINYMEKSVDNLSGTIKIGTTMRMEVQKDPLTFIEIAKIIVNKHPNVEFIFVGDGHLNNEVKECIQKYNLGKRVKLLGFQKNVIDIVGSFDIYLITSLYEGLPYSIIEAISLGKPIVATNVTGNNEIVKNGYNGLLFEAMNAQEGAEKIESLLNNISLINEYGLNSRKLYKEYFTIEQMMEALDMIYNNVKPNIKRIEPIEKKIGSILFNEDTKTSSDY